MIIDMNAWLGTWPFRSLRDNTPAALVKRLERSGIDMAAVSFIEAAFHRHPQSANERLAEAVAPHPDRLIPLGTLSPHTPHWEHDLEACGKNLGMKGIRLFPGYHDYPANGPVAIDLVKACAAAGLPVFIPHRMEDSRQHHRMDSHGSVDLNALADLVAAVPEATLVIPNARPLARSPLWRREELRELNWYVDLSLAEIHYGLHKDLKNKRDLADMIEEGGAGHLLFGTHLPISYAGPALVKRALLPVDAEELEAISYKRAAEILGLDIG